MKGKLLASLLPMAAVVFCSCTPKGTGMPYAKATADIESMLRERVDKGIFPYSREDSGRGTSFRFIEGDRWNKEDHVSPLRIEIVVRALDEGRDCRVEVEAIRDEILIKSKDEESAKRWREGIRAATTSNGA